MNRTVLFLFPLLLAFYGAASVGADEKIIEARTNPLRWEPKEVVVKTGDVVIWKVAQCVHGVMFNDFDRAKTALQIEQGSLPIGQQPGFDLPAQGTVGKGVTVPLLVKATIKEIPAGMTEIGYFCTIHPDEMVGKVRLQASGSAGNARSSSSPSSDRK